MADLKRKSSHEGAPKPKKRATEAKAMSKEPSPASSPESSLEPEEPTAHSNNEEEDAEEQPEEKQTFAELGVVDVLVEACTALKYTKPTPIQAQSIPLAVSGRDIIGLAETGSGKTVAFALPILQALLDKPQPFFGLILAPTRELANQIAEVMRGLGAGIGLRSTVIVGGLPMPEQSIALGKKPHVIVATPGRLLDHLEKTKGFSLRNLKYLVMDEADRLLDMDFGPAIDKILKFLPRERNTYLFSATMSSKVESLQRASLRNPAKVSISSDKYKTVSGLQQHYIFIPQVRKDTYLVHLVNRYVGRRIIIFTRLVWESQRLTFLLRSLGFGAIPLHGQLTQSKRMGALNKFSSGDRDILVATDIAARGLDVPNVDVVINFDLPQDSKTYIHRVGRTARAGKTGMAINITTQYDVELLLRLEHFLKKKLPEYPTEKEEVMTFQPRVEEAQRLAKAEVKDLRESQNSKRGGSSRGDRRDNKRQGRKKEINDSEGY